MKTPPVLARSLLLGLLVTGCASEAPRTVQVICQEVPAYSSRWGSETSSSVFLGNMFQVTAASLTSRLRITGAQGDSDTVRFLEARCVAPYPLQGQARWIQAPTPAPPTSEGLVSRASGPGWDMGDEVEVLTVNESWVPAGQSAVLKQGNVLGFIPATALGDKPPPLERYTEALRAQLANHTFDAALTLTRRALRFFPQEALLHRLQGHLVTLSGGTPPKPPKHLPRLAALPDILPEQPLVLSDEESASTTPLTLYTTAVGLRLRESAETSAKVLATLPMNQRLVLDSLFDEDWAQVTRLDGVQARLGADGAFIDFVDSPTVQGYVSRRFLARAPLDAGQLLVRGQEALKAGRSEEALVLLHRAFEAQPDLDLNPSNAAYLGLIEASFAGARFESLFQAITSRQQAKLAAAPRVKPAHPLVVMGCHGDMARAKILDLRVPQTEAWAGPGAAAAQMKEPHLCVAHVDTREPLKPELCEGCSRSPGFTQAEQLYKKTLVPEYAKWSEKVRDHYDSSPYFYFVPKELNGFDPSKRWVFYNLPLEGGPIEDDQIEDLEGVKLLRSEARVAVLDIPTWVDWNQLEVWIELPGSLDSEFGVALVDKEEQVSEWLQQREDFLDYGDFRVAKGRLPYAARPGATATFPVFSDMMLTSVESPFWGLGNL